MSLATLLLALCPTANPSAERFDALVEEARKAWDVPGLALVVVSSDRTVHLKGYGLRQLGRSESITPDSTFPLASCTKAFTTTLAAMLVDEAKLKWDDPVRKHLNDFRLADPAANELVSLRDLAAHRTGVAAHDLLWYRSPFTQVDLVHRAGKLPLSKPFRKDMQYQSVMYLALGQAIAKAGGDSWENLIETRILKPLEMKATTLTTVAASKAKDLATGHRLNSDGKLAVVSWYEQITPNPAGSIHTTARDLVPWLQLHLNLGKHNNQQLVSESSLLETHQPHTIVPLRGEVKRLMPDTLQMSYGLGWVAQDYRGELVVQHAGLIDGFRVHITLLPNRGYAFAILANREATRLNLALSNSIVDLMLGLPSKDWNGYFGEIVAEEELAKKLQNRREDLGRKPTVLPDVPIERLAGKYEEAAYGASSIHLEKDRLIWEWGPWKIPLDHYGGNVFQLRSENVLLDRAFLTFEVSEGRSTSYRLLGLSFQRGGK